jgi:uncharacterized membrane protein (UPF0127 family)
MKNPLPQVIFALLAVLVLLLIAFLRTSAPRTVRVNDVSISVELAQSSIEKSKGLCCRDWLGEDSGMLFVYDKPGDYRFWMKDTRIPLDMYWINGEKSIVHIEENVQPGSYPKSFSSPKPAQYTPRSQTSGRHVARH